MKLSYKFHTFGCKVNTYDTGRLQDLQSERPAFSSTSEVINSCSEVHVINSCAVTAEASREALRLARKLKKEDGSRFVVVTGCAAQVDGSLFDPSSSGVDLVVANSHKSSLFSLIEASIKESTAAKENGLEAISLEEKRVYRSNIFLKKEFEEGGGREESHTRSFLKIQDGCNSFCSFCIIPFARGRSRSLPKKQILKRLLELEREGVKEVVLTGIHIADYEDENEGLDALVGFLLENTTIPRLRLTSLEPIELTDSLISFFSDERMCSHLHLSIQSVNSRVLETMRRRYDRRLIEERLSTIATKISSAFVGMDVIAGFPEETEDEFLETFKVLSETPWTRLHVFPFSPRPGTRAAKMTQWSREVIKSRALRLRELSHIRFEAEARKQIGSTKKVLLYQAKRSAQAKRKPHTEGNSHVERTSQASRNSPEGLSRDYWNVRIRGDLQNYNKNHEIFVKVRGLGNQTSSYENWDGKLEGEVIN